MFIDAAADVEEYEVMFESVRPKSSGHAGHWRKLKIKGKDATRLSARLSCQSEL